jgi:predicted ATPase
VLDSAAPTWLVQLPGVLDRAEADALHHRTVGASSERMLRELGAALELLTVERPLVLVCEDLHDSDRPTIELLGYLARRREPARLLIVGTYRPAEVISRSHPVRQLVRDLRAREQCGFLPLELLTRAAVATYVARRITPRRPSEAFVDDIHQRTDGNALFVTTLLGYLIDHGLLVEDGGQTTSREPLDRLGIPDSVAQFIERQVGELAEADRHLLEVAAAIGVEFSAEAVVAGAAYDQAQVDAAEIERRLSDLAANTGLVVEEEVAEWPDGTLTGQFRFLHALYQELLYSHLPPARRAAVHRRVGDRLATGFGPRATELAAELAMHFERGRDRERAIHYLAHAADTALERCAPREALDYAERALQLLDRGEALINRAETELQLRMKQAVAMVTLWGFGGPGLDAAYQTARSLCAEVGDPTLLGPVLYGLWKFALVRGELGDAEELGGELRRLADRHPDLVLELQAHHAAGCNDHLAGRHASALAHCDRVFDLYDPVAHRRLTGVYGEDPAVACHQFAAVAAWLLGHPDRARWHASESCRLADELAYPSETIQAALIAASVHLLCGDVDRVREATAALFELCHRYDVSHIWLALGRVVDGWAIAHGGEAATAVPQMRKALDEVASAGSQLILHSYSSMLAEALVLAGDIGAALETATAALHGARRSGELWYEAELVRLRGAVLLEAGSPAAEAEAAFVEALEIARRQDAKSLELRAAMSLARLWQAQGEPHRGRELLGDIYTWFTEGHDTAYLRAAATLLAELGDRREATAPMGDS